MMESRQLHLERLVLILTECVEKLNEESGDRIPKELMDRLRAETTNYMPHPTIIPTHEPFRQQSQLH